MTDEKCSPTIELPTSIYDKPKASIQQKNRRRSLQTRPSDHRFVRSNWWVMEEESNGNIFSKSTAAVCFINLNHFHLINFEQKNDERKVKEKEKRETITPINFLSTFYVFFSSDKLRNFLSHWSSQRESRRRGKSDIFAGDSLVRMSGERRELLWSIFLVHNSFLNLLIPLFRHGNVESTGKREVKATNY